VAQLLYNLGLEYEDDVNDAPPNPITGLIRTNAPWPPLKTASTSPTTWKISPACRVSPLPLRESALPKPHPSQPHRPRTAVAARVLYDMSPPDTAPESQLGPKISSTKLHHKFFGMVARTKASLASELVSEFLVTKKDLTPIYMSPCPYFDAFEEEINLRKFDFRKHRTAGLGLAHVDGRLFLVGMAPSTPGAKIQQWRTRIKGERLIMVGDTPVLTITKAQLAFQRLQNKSTSRGILLFSHPEIRPDLTHDGIPIVSSAPFHQQVHDQLNRRWEFNTVAEYLRKAPPYKLVEDGNVLNVNTKVMKLTRGKLIHQEDWNNWLESEYIQLDQYHTQSMFGLPVAPNKGDAIFHLVWTYNIKAVDGRKKARCVCNSSTRSSQVRVLAETYANCIEQTSAQLFYAVAAIKNLLVFGADISNAFAEAPAPKQPFFIQPNKAFHKWWVNHLKRDPIPQGHIILVLKAMQGHLESPCLWEKHADKILCKIGLTPTVHKPCLYSGTFNSKCVLFMRQVDDFAIAAPDLYTSDMLMDLIDYKLSVPIK
jgi:hypothetical protein